MWRSSLEMLGGELAAGGVYVLTSAGPQGRRQAQLSRVPQKFPRLVLRGGKEAGVRPVKTEEVQVVERMIEELG